MLYISCINNLKGRIDIEIIDEVFIFALPNFPQVEGYQNLHGNALIK